MTCCLKLFSSFFVCDQLLVAACDWWEVLAVTLTDCICVCAEKDNKSKYFPLAVMTDIWLCLFCQSVCFACLCCLCKCASVCFFFQCSVCFVSFTVSMLPRQEISLLFSVPTDGWQPYWATYCGVYCQAQVCWTESKMIRDSLLVGWSVTEPWWQDGKTQSTVTFCFFFPKSYWLNRISFLCIIQCLSGLWNIKQKSSFQ